MSLIVIAGLSFLATIAATSIDAYLESGAAPFLTALLSATFLFFLWNSYNGIREVFRVQLLPYFSLRLGDADTFLKGKALLWHSRALDEIAAKRGWQPLSQFASGDDMVLGEKLRWFDPAPALETTRQLLESEEANSFPEELKIDLRALRDALASADKKNARFCLLLREGSTASGLEMDRRVGSFF